MYSREEKIQYLEALVSNGYTMSEAERLPGWPSRATLRIWVRQARQGELPAGLVPTKGHAGDRRRHRRYSDETKARAVRLYGLGRRPSQIARALGIDCPANIRVWAKKAEEEGRPPRDGFAPKPFGPGRSEEQVGKKKKEVPPEVAALGESELENACLRAVLADLKAGGWDPGSISNRKKVELGERLRAETGRALREITAFLGISKSSYEYHRARLGEPDKYCALRLMVAELFREARGRCGYRPIWALLRGRGVRVSEKVVRRIMREEGLEVRYPGRRRKWSSYEGETPGAPANIVARDFAAGLPNFLWLTDITEFRLPDFKCYLSPVIDCFDGRVAAWNVSLSPDADLANSMLDEAIGTLSEGERPVVHSDRGGHYRWPGWVSRCDEAGLTRSMSRKGCSPDNAACEGFFGRLKNEFFYYRSWKGVSFEQFAEELSEYIGWYNSKRIKKSLGWMSPDDFRASLGLAV